MYWSIVTSCAYRAAASLPLSVEGFIWRGLGNQGLGSPRLLVWSSDASFGRPRGGNSRLVRFCGARVDARAPRAVRRVSARTGAHERRKVGREAAGASVSQPEKSRKGEILGGFWDAWNAARKCDFFFRQTPLASGDKFVISLRAHILRDAARTPSTGPACCGAHRFFGCVSKVGRADSLRETEGRPWTGGVKQRGRIGGVSKVGGWISLRGTEGRPWTGGVCPRWEGGLS